MFLEPRQISLVHKKERVYPILDALQSDVNEREVGQYIRIFPILQKELHSHHF